MREGLPQLLANVRVMATVSRYYGRSAALTDFLAKVGGQAMRRCRQWLLEHGPLWGQDRQSLLGRLDTIVELADAYQVPCCGGMQGLGGVWHAWVKMRSRHKTGRGIEFRSGLAR